TIFFFTSTRKLLFYIISIILALALYNNAFNTPSLITALVIFRLRLLSYIVYMPLC
ncbi:hypothetical protein DER44DRAFT_670242, partial [Fusarium oxysporum]